VTNKILKLELKGPKVYWQHEKKDRRAKNMTVKGQHYITTKRILKKLSIRTLKPRKVGGLERRTAKRRSF